MITQMMNDNDTWETLSSGLPSHPILNLLDDSREVNADHDGQEFSAADSDSDGATASLYRPSLISRLGHHPVLMAAILATLIAIAYGGSRFWNYTQSYERTDDAQIDAHVSAITSLINGTVSRVYVEDYQRVKTGQLLIQLDPRENQVAVEQARAQLAQAEADVDSSRQQYASARAEIREAQARDVEARRTEQRYSTLLRLGVVSQADYDQFNAIASAQGAQVRADQADAAVALDDIAAREAEVEAAKIRADEAILNLGDTRIVAPADGIVSQRNVELDQRVEPGQSLMAVTQDSGVRVTASFEETQLARMRRGQAVTVHVDAIERDFRGHVRDMPGDIGGLYSLLPLENTTGDNVVVVPRLPVRIAFDPGQDLTGLRPGMSAETTVWVK